MEGKYKDGGVVATLLCIEEETNCDAGIRELEKNEDVIGVVGRCATVYGGVIES